MKISLHLLVALCGLWTLPAAAEIHRCTAADGSTVFSDVPCGEEATVFKPLQPANPAESSLRNDRRDRLLRAFEEERQLEREQAAEEKAERARRARKCAQAKDDLRVMKQAGRMYDLDDDGNRVYLSNTQRAEALRDMRAAVEHWCGKQ
jgi:hypothetical protein